MLISQILPDTLFKLNKSFEEKIGETDNLEEAAHFFVHDLYTLFKDSIQLIRLFITLPMGEIPTDIQIFANNLAKGAGIPVPLERDAKILTLLGTAGVAPEWNDRKQSKGHLGIPLISMAFVNAIPMMSALLEQLGFDLGWIRGEKEIVARSIGSLGGTFYVSDASTTKDSKERLIISSQDFVKKYNIHSVFGFGGGYSQATKFMVTIIFCKEYINQSRATMFQGLTNIFKLKTNPMIKNKNLYFRNT